MKYLPVEPSANILSISPQGLGSAPRAQPSAAADDAWAPQQSTAAKAVGAAPRPSPEDRAGSSPPTSAPSGPFTVAVQAHATQHGVDLLRCPRVLEQLSWLQNTHVVTSESHARRPKAAGKPLHDEVQRALSRIANLCHLEAGDGAAYARFIAPQCDDVLRRESFDRLSAIVAQLPGPAREVVAASCVLAPSEVAAAGAKAQRPPVELPADSEQCLTALATHCPHIFPAYVALSPPAKLLFSAAYLPGSHLRHMLYTEGGNNMFYGLRRLIVAGQLTDTAFGIWVGRWIVNIAGFRGHEAGPSGSLYLTEPTAQAIFMLLDELATLRRQPTYEPLIGYLRRRGEALGLRSAYLIHLACMARVYSKDEAKQLTAWHDMQTPEQQLALDETYKAGCIRLQVTPTYLPSLLNNARRCVPLQEALATHVRVVGAAQQVYDAAVASKQVSPDTPMCLRELAKKAEYLCKLPSEAKPTLEATKAGVILLRDDRSTAPT